MKVLEYINKKSADNTITIISKNSIAVLSSEDYSLQANARNANQQQNSGNASKKNKNNKKKPGNPNTIFYGKVQYLLKNKRMMSWISDIEILNEVTFQSETLKAKKQEVTIPDLDQIEI